MLRTRCIFSDRDVGLDLRISIMSRHTLNDGVTPDELIDDADFDAWFKQLAPPAKLVGPYLRGEIGWQKFEEQYKDQLSSPMAYEWMMKVINIARSEHTVTLLCKEPDASYCHRRLVAERCKKIAPDLIVDIQ